VRAAQQASMRASFSRVRVLLCTKAIGLRTQLSGAPQGAWGLLKTKAACGLAAKRVMRPS
jgi:hypothetical protein